MPRALILDDNAVNLELMTFLLEADGFEVIPASNAEDALTSLESACPDVMLVDIQLPGMSGFDFIKRVRTDRRLCRACIVVVTSYAMESDRVAAAAAGCNGYIAKPIDTRSFAAAIRRVMGRENRGPA